MKPVNQIPMAELKDGWLYRIYARNAIVGIWDQVKDGWLYRIYARNAIVGIWDQVKQKFTISRYKFGDNYLFEEQHYDSPPGNTGTAWARREIEHVPEDIIKDPALKLDYLNLKAKLEYEGEI
jgi:hypothetical protein